MIDIILICVIALALGGAGRYIYKAKKSGRTCIGCPDSCACGGHSGGGCCGCGDHHSH